MKRLTFKVITRKTIEINFPKKLMYEFPVHEDYLTEGQEILVVYKFKPTTKLDSKMEGFIESLKSHFKIKYRAESVILIDS